MKGFLLSARNQIPEAIKSFDEAIALDGALGNAWLGRGLCRIRSGQAEPDARICRWRPRSEPNRALLRSYLGKAFSETRDDARPGMNWHWPASLIRRTRRAGFTRPCCNQQQNRINEAIRDLEQSQ